MVTPPMVRLPALQRIVPPFSRVRPPDRKWTAELLRLNVAPAAITVRPLPLIVPPSQLNSSSTTNMLLPPKVMPLLNDEVASMTAPEPLKFTALLLGRERFRQRESLLTVIVAEFGIVTSSSPSGTRFGDQLAGVCQSPVAPFVQVIS